MKIEYRTIKDGVLQITTADERWYKVGEQFLPSATFILDSYPKGVGFTQWLKRNGENSDLVSQEAMDRGSRVHRAVEVLVAGGTIKHDDKISGGGDEAELDAQEYGAVLSFQKWWEATKPTLISSEITVMNLSVGYAGTVDLILKIGDNTWLIDLKTSKEVYPSHELQVSAYSHCTDLEGNAIQVDRLAILQVGYTRNKNGYKLTEVKDDFETFVALKKVFDKEHGADKPKQADYPLSITL